MAISEDTLSLLNKFVCVGVLFDDSQSKKIVVHGKIDNVDAILTLEKSAFKEKTVSNNYIKELLATEINDVYHWGVINLDEDIQENPSCKYSLIYPATETHLRKYKPSKLKMIVETPEAYNEIVKPYIESMKGDRIQWVKNILYNGAEADRVLFKNNDFIVLPDLKWDGKDVNMLYCCSIVYDDSISSIRDLNHSHIEYLTKIEKNLISEITNKYASQGIQSSDLRLYVHYQPSYYHFHIHIVNINNFSQYGSLVSGKAILLHDIIENLKYYGPNGYADKVITYQLQDTHALWELGLKNYIQE